MSGDALYLQHTLDAIKEIECYTAVGRDVFMSTSHWQDATIRQLEIIGEATKRLSDALRADHDDVPWRRIAGLRDVLIHDDMGVDDVDAVWEVTATNLPDLRKRVQAILQARDALGSP